jgi:hypothetical protein
MRLQSAVAALDEAASRGSGAVGVEKSGKQAEWKHQSDGCWVICQAAAAAR